VVDGVMLVMIDVAVVIETEEVLLVWWVLVVLVVLGSVCFINECS